ncbi:geranylgeranyl reductase family protein [Cryptosporangium arvum]|uniref:Geranylgeranyl reductase family protein n=1 Tax=Cryptosporangium arvum DSM 44712 TaxID=927661 RepID=A0A010ZNF8_9ACTN|nr:geranylgeranyl reductase family protein [Cryptosporangium arvum]EXG80219.1 geranylgeranyl reductase family protein [Cryptosporangium arvum DSM 44712]
MTASAEYDVAVIGAGPAGASAARVAAEAGARVLMLERGALPRYKTCGGGLIGLSRAALPAGFTPPVRDRIDRLTFTLRGRLRRTWRADAPFIDLVYRDEFDAALTAAAVDAGAKLQEGVTVTGLEPAPGLVRIRTAEGEVTAGAVVGADGTSGRSGGYVGVRLAQVDLGLETEFAWPDASAGDWAGRVLIDWGPLPGSYGWVFPKGDALTVGVIAERGQGAATKEYLAALVDRAGVGGAPEIRSSGHLTRCRTDDSPLYRDRVLVAGDAAGLLEPWTREGISYALRSGRLAGAAAVAVARSDADALPLATAGYAAAVEAEFGAEMRAGRRFHTAFSRRPTLFHAAIGCAPPAWRLFRRLVGGETTLEHVAAHKSVDLALRVLSADRSLRSGQA